MEIPGGDDHIFQKDAEEIFSKADVNPKRYPAMFKETKAILAHTMAQLSRTRGLSYDRVSLYDQKKLDIVRDLLKHKAEGRLSDE